jgi:hypothetical protein
MAKKWKETEKKEEPVVTDPGVVTVEALRDYNSQPLTIRKGDQRMVPFEVARAIIDRHGDNPPIRIVKSLTSPFNKAIQAEETK